MSWGIAESALEKEKLKAELADELNGMNSCGKIDYDSYSYLFDFGMSLLDEMYKLGKKSKWIKMKDKMPEDLLEPGSKKRTIKVLVCRKGNRASARTETRRKGENDWYWASDAAEWGHLTHWMPLPKPPKEK